MKHQATTASLTGLQPKIAGLQRTEFTTMFDHRQTGITAFLRQANKDIKACQSTEGKASTMPYSTRLAVWHSILETYG